MDASKWLCSLLNPEIGVNQGSWIQIAREETSSVATISLVRVVRPHRESFVLDLLTPKITYRSHASRIWRGADMLMAAPQEARYVLKSNTLLLRTYRRLLVLRPRLANI